MNNYMSSYEQYYKNLNNKKRNNGAVNNYKGKNKATLNLRINKNMLINKIITTLGKQLVGACIFLILFISLKYVPVNEIQDAYKISKKVLSQTTDYDYILKHKNYINLKNFNISNFNINDLSGNDLNINDLKNKVDGFINYLREESKMGSSN